MTPLPKKKHSHARTTTRRNAAVHRLVIPNLSACPSCKKLKASHQVCEYCGYYKNS